MHVSRHWEIRWLRWGGQRQLLGSCSGATFVRTGRSMMMSRQSDEYRRRAREAEAMAEAVRDLEAKQLFLATAERWRKLAEIAEQRGWYFRI